MLRLLLTSSQSMARIPPEFDHLSGADFYGRRGRLGQVDDLSGKFSTFFVGSVLPVCSRKILLLHPSEHSIKRSSSDGQERAAHGRRQGERRPMGLDQLNPSVHQKPNSYLTFAPKLLPPSQPMADVTPALMVPPRTDPSIPASARPAPASAARSRYPRSGASVFFRSSPILIRSESNRWTARP